MTTNASSGSPSPSSANSDSERTGFGFALGAYLFWGLAPIYWKLVDGVPAGQLTAHRVVQTLVCLLAFLVVARRQSPASLFADRAATRAHLLAGVLLALNWLTFVYAVSTERVVEVSLGYFINPLITVVLGMVFFGERLSQRRWLALGLATLGVVVLAVESGSLPWISLILACSFAVYSAIKKQSTKGPIEGLAIEMVWIAPLALAYLAYVLMAGQLTAGGSTGSMLFLLLVGFATATPLLLFARAARAIPLWAIGLMQYIAPTIQFLLGVLVYGESANPTRLVGFGIIWIGLIVFAADSLATSRRS